MKEKRRTGKQRGQKECVKILTGLKEASSQVKTSKVNIEGGNTFSGDGE